MWQILQKLFGEKYDSKVFQTYFGELFLNGQQKCYSGMVDKEGTDLCFNLIVDVLTEDELKRLLPDLNKLMKLIVKLDKSARDYSAKEILKVKNEEWRSINESVINKTEFVARMKLMTIFFRPDNSFGMEYEAERLFKSHRIHVDFSSRFKALSVTL